MKSYLSLALFVMLMATSAMAGTECDVCQYVVGEMETYLNGNSTLTEIETFVEKICGMYPSYETTCQHLIKTYLPTVIEKLEADFTPEMICKDIHFCSATQLYGKLPTGMVINTLLTKVSVKTH